ncbi:hypothetical protein V2H45_00840 [Tumidithrix elongata RA019]|uniref:Outer membrane protein beta-barrel domain-containing protein n=1 Tax=Tumidithrix elongata BACA0141 TaxID=2716417 RepID=A0AAW9PVT6_9CYAN|nr:hypothetical protein [Tumidithrix elongata RA019]
MKFLIKSGLSLTFVGLVSIGGALEAHAQSALNQNGNRVNNSKPSDRVTPRVIPVVSPTIKLNISKSAVPDLEAGQEVNPANENYVDPNSRKLGDAQQFLAQTKSPTLEEANRLRQELTIPPLDPDVQLGTPVYFPSSSPGGIPSGFGANLGDVYLGLFGSTAGKARDYVDASFAIGTGVGDSRKAVGLEATYNLTSFRNFASNGTFDLKLHRMVFESDRLQVAAAIGWTNFANYGSNAGGTPSSVYGVVTSAFLLRPEDPKYNFPVTVSVGVGGGVYRPESLQNTSGGVGVFGSVGVQVHPQVALSTGWTGQGLNVGLSFVPSPSIPLNINAIYSDIGNSSTAGSQFILGLTYGFNFSPRF